MIADKILPSFYLLELKGEIASFEQIVGQRFNIKSIHIASGDFGSDVEAMAAAESVVEFLLQNPQVKIEESTSKCTKQFNPDFYPMLDALEVSDETLEEEERVQAQALMLAEKDPTFSSAIITKRFDDIGDFIAYRMNIQGENFDLQLKVGVDPHVYILEKQKDQQEEAERQYGKLTEHRQLTH
jgi:hypothetical protein